MPIKKEYRMETVLFYGDETENYPLHKTND